MHIFLRVHRSFNINGDVISYYFLSVKRELFFSIFSAGESNVLQLIFFFLKIQMSYDDNLTFL